jgi:hypothetical protein
MRKPRQEQGDRKCIQSETHSKERERFMIGHKIISLKLLIFLYWRALMIIKSKIKINHPKCVMKYL